VTAACEQHRDFLGFCHVNLQKFEKIILRTLPVFRGIFALHPACSGAPCAGTFMRSV
jgi:hypothetical protein